MRKDTIEVKLTSYGTLEVVTIPVKLYKDSYKVVKLRAVAIDKGEQAIMKVYTSAEDESGEIVWTSKAYELPSIDIEIVGGVVYRVYEDYIPQEFCAEDGDIVVNFAYVDIDDNKVEQIITTGELNLFIGGNGYNANGVVLPQNDGLASKINQILADKGGYDLKIRTQGEFEAFCQSIEDGTCTATSVLFVGDGGNLKFSKIGGYGLWLPTTLKRIDGINNAIIYATNNSVDNYHSAYVLSYKDKPTTDGYSISNLTIISEKGESSRPLNALGSFVNVINCHVEVDLANFSMGIVNCDNLVNCSVIGNSSGGAYQGYYNCSNLVNCSVNAGVRFVYCQNLVNCIITGTDNPENFGAFYQCKNVSSTCMGNIQYSNARAEVGATLGDIDTAINNLSTELGGEIDDKTSGVVRSGVDQDVSGEKYFHADNTYIDLDRGKVAIVDNSGNGLVGTSIGDGEVFVGTFNNYGIANKGVYIDADGVDVKGNFTRNGVAVATTDDVQSALKNTNNVGLNTTNKTIIGAINELNAKITASSSSLQNILGV
jgi:hypothetical protein